MTHLLLIFEPSTFIRREETVPASDLAAAINSGSWRPTAPLDRLLEDVPQGQIYAVALNAMGLCDHQTPSGNQCSAAGARGATEPAPERSARIDGRGFNQQANRGASHSFQSHSQYAYRRHQKQTECPNQRAIGWARHRAGLLPPLYA